MPDLGFVIRSIRVSGLGWGAGEGVGFGACSSPYMFMLKLKLVIPLMRDDINNLRVNGMASVGSKLCPR
jgi:hypothetical protein